MFVGGKRLFEATSQLVERGRSTIVYLNVHVANIAARRPALQGALERADIVYCDGAGIQLGAWLAGEPVPDRMTGADFIWDLARLAEQERWRWFWVGGRPGVAARAMGVLRERHPGLEVCGTHHGYFTKHGPESDAVIAEINRARPQIVFVGMGTPTQELWVDDNRDRIEAPVVWCIGATADFLAGAQPRAPRWMSKHGLEWLHRLAVDPRRMFSRYVIGNPVYLYRVLKNRARRSIGGGAR